MILAYGERMPRVLFVAVFYVVAELTNGFVADLTAVVAELDVADSTCRRLDLYSSVCSSASGFR